MDRQTNSDGSKPRTVQGDLARLPTGLGLIVAMPNWVTWRWKQNGAKWTKIPHQPSGSLAKSDDPTTWNEHATCVTAFATGNFDGIGFCLMNSGLAAFDVDNCRDPDTGTIKPFATELMERCGSYSEVTPSGTGIRIIGLSSGGDARHKKYPVNDGVSVEIYRGATRYITVSGLAIGAADMVNIDAVVDDVYAACEAERERRTSSASNSTNGSGEHRTEPSGGGDETRGTGELTAKLIELLNMPNGGAGQQHGKYANRSDLLLAFLTGCARGNVPKPVAGAACVDDRYAGKAIREHCRDNAGTANYIERQIGKAWKLVASTFEQGSDHKPKPKSQHNVRLALAKLNIELSYDEFNDRTLIVGLDGYTELNDAASNKLWLMIDDKFKFLPAVDLFRPLLGTVARENSFHPVREYLDDLKWDGIKRLDEWLVTYCGAENTPYTRAVGRIVLVAAVRRIRQPGCKFDEMVILEGPQGTEKSTLLGILAVKPEWFSDDLPLNADGKKIIEQLQGKWIVEAPELSGMKRADVEHLKAMLSRQTDRARLAYGYFSVDMRRQFIIIGTTNSTKYLRDVTGHRRFWPFRIGVIKLDLVTADRDQLWAEAAHLEKQKTSIRLDQSLWGDAALEQADRTMVDPWLETLEAAIGDLNGKILNEDAWTIIGQDPDRRNQDSNVRLGTAMRAIGFERAKLRFGGKPKWGYVRGSRPEDREKRIAVTRTNNEVLVAHVSDEEDGIAL